MKGQILLIDDNPLDLKIASLALERTGFACFTFEHPAEALGWLQGNQPSVIFLDLQMPQMSGFDLIKIFRNNSATAKTPIIIISGKNKADDVFKAIELGANDYVVKPLDMLVLQEKVSRIGAAQNATEEFTTVQIPEGKHQEAFFAKPLRITQISEFGVVLESETKVDSGVTMEVRGLNKEFFGLEGLLVRCLSVDEILPGLWTMQFTFVGMNESQRQLIRKVCRRLWIENRANSGPRKAKEA